jgi:hypothetical protein
MLKVFSFLILFLLSSFFLFAKERKSPLLPQTGTPGQIEEKGESRKIYFEENVSLEWSGSQLVLQDGKAKVIRVDLSTSPEKLGAREGWGEKVVEQDLGGTSKKKAPLAYKNPKFREIRVPGGENPLKGAGMKPARVSEETTSEGGKIVTTDYPDKSKSVVSTSATLKEESSYNKKGELIWRNIEGEDHGIHFKKTQWEDGSLIREYSRPQGVVSVVFDVEKNNYTFSFLNPNREVIKEVVCMSGSCEES